MENGHPQLANGLTDTDAGKEAAGQVEGSSAASDGAVNSLQDEILALGPEAAGLHQKLAALFSSWLADEKEAAAELERRRKQYEADNVRDNPLLYLKSAMHESTSSHQPVAIVHGRPSRSNREASLIASCYFRNISMRGQTMSQSHPHTEVFVKFLRKAPCCRSWLDLSWKLPRRQK